VIVTVARSLGGITYRHGTETMTAHLARLATADHEACNKTSFTDSTVAPDVTNYPATRAFSIST
jgi:hypothetical protein